MSDQPPLTPPSAPSPGFEPYQAPAYGDVAPDAPTQPAPHQPAPHQPAPHQPASYPPPYQVAPQYVVHHGVPNHPLATTSLVLGIVGLVGLVLTPLLYISFFAVVCSPVAIWLGVKARRQIREHPQVHGGHGLATAGFVTGIIGVVLGVLGVVLVVAIIAIVVTALNNSGA